MTEPIRGATHLDSGHQEIARQVTAKLPTTVGTEDTGFKSDEELGVPVFWLAPGLVPAVYGHGGDASLIHACVQQGSLQVRIVGPNEACRGPETAVHWSITGPQGPKGDKGDQGDKGDKGDTGAQGQAGTWASFDQLDGLACTLNGQAGTVDVSYSAGGAVLRCVTAARFFDNDDGTITDTQTGLQWEKKTDDETVHDVTNRYTWSSPDSDAPDGTAFTNFLEQVNGKRCSNPSRCQGLGGHSDWRLPTIAELQSILLAPYNGLSECTSRCIDAIFGPTESDFYWSSTTLTGAPSEAYDVHGGSGLVYWDTKSAAPFYVRAVRGGQ